MLGATFVCLLLSLIPVAAQYRHDHLTTSCTADITTSVGGRLEASTELTYQNNMNCIFKVHAPDSKQILILFNWFELERKVDGACVDYLNIHDGNDVTATSLNTEPLCGELKSLSNLTTSGYDVTFQFVTDADAVARGFDLTYTVFSYAPCSTEEFACSNGLCISATLKCDSFSQCGDDSDEATDLCTVSSTATSWKLSMGAIFGIAGGGLVLLIILIVLLYKVIDYYKWQKWLKSNDLHTNPWDEEEVFQYPVTKHYHSNIARVTSPPPDEAQEVTSPEDQVETSREEGDVKDEKKLLPERSMSLMLSRDDLAKPGSSQA